MSELKSGSKKSSKSAQNVGKLNQIKFEIKLNTVPESNKMK